MAINASQRYKLGKLVSNLEKYRGRHTELVTVYIPQGYDLNNIINHLSEEQGTATNIKSKSTRENVISALEKMIQHLRLFKQTPENGLAIFSGNVAEREGQQDYQVWSVEPPVPINIRLYRCDKEFLLDPLREMLETKEVYGMVVMDRREANIALLKGKTIIELSKSKSNVPGKTRAGGQCLTKDSLIQLSDGPLSKIEKVHNPNIVKSMAIKANSIKDSNITDKWNVKKSQVYKIITKHPRLFLETSKDHIFFVLYNGKIIEKSAEKLKVDDYLIMPERIDVEGKIQKLYPKKYYNSTTITNEGRNLLQKKRLEKSLNQKQLARELEVTQTAISAIELGKRNIKRDLLKKLCNRLNIDFENFLKKNSEPYLYRDIKLPEKIDKDFAQFLGYLMGDGSIEKYRISFSEQNKEIALSYQKKYNKFFSIKSSYKFRETKNYHQIRFTSRPLIRLIKNEFPELKKARDSVIPEKILKSPNSIIAAFLRGFFDAEGYVSSKLGLGINNKVLAQQIQMLFLRFGIISSVMEYDNSRNPYSNNKRYVLEISEKKSLKLFDKVIGFSSKIKDKRLKGTLKNKTDRCYVRQIAVPGSKVRKIIEKAGYNLELFPKVSSFFRNERMMSKEIFRKSILNNIKDKKLYSELKQIMEIPLLPVRINEIKVIRKKTDMVDISVKNMNFIANGIFVHNSAPRFERLREGAAKDFYKKIGNMMKEQFLENKDVKGIIVGGPGPTKHDFVEGNYITDQVKRKIIAIKDLSYTGEFGLQELLDKSQDVLANEEVAAEKQIMQRFFELLSKKPNMVSYGLKEVEENLNNGVVDTLLLSEDLSEEVISRLDEIAKQYSTDVQIISTETREGVQLRDIGKIAAILRYEIS